MRDEGEDLAGVTVHVGTDKTVASSIANAVSGADGSYMIAGIAPGTYYLIVEATPTTLVFEQAITVADDAHMRNDVLLSVPVTEEPDVEAPEVPEIPEAQEAPEKLPAATGGISGYLWVDGDGSLATDWDGLRNGNEQTLPGYTVYLYAANDLTSAIAATTTDAGGAYIFTGLVPGGYVVGVEDDDIGAMRYLTPMAVTKQSVFAVDWNLSDTDEPYINRAYSAPITIVAGAYVQDINAGMRQPMGAAPYITNQGYVVSSDTIPYGQLKADSLAEAFKYVNMYNHTGWEITALYDDDHVEPFVLNKNRTVTLKSGGSGTKTLVQIPKSRHGTVNGTLILSNITLDGWASMSGSGNGNYESSHSNFWGGGLLINDGGKVIMENKATISNCVNRDTSTDGGAVQVKTGGTLTMNTGSTIRGNGSYFSTNSAGNAHAYGGGVYVDTGATFNMLGGTISNNFVFYYANSGAVNDKLCGGGVYSKGTFNMSGGSITGNAAIARIASGTNLYNMTYGAGVYVASGTFTMNGSASITSNGNSLQWMRNGGVPSTVRTYQGGGVYVAQSGRFTMAAGTMNTNNAVEGGGIYTEDYDYHDPADTAKYMNITVSGSATVSGNVADSAATQPTNADAFTNRSASPFNGQLLDNNNVNYRNDGVVNTIITYKPNNDGDPAYPDKVIDTGAAGETAVTILSNAAAGFVNPPGAHPDWVFIGWNTMPDDSGVRYQEGANVLVSGDVVLYAQWGVGSAALTLSNEWQITKSGSNYLVKDLLISYAAGQTYYIKSDYSLTTSATTLSLSGVANLINGYYAASANNPTPASNLRIVFGKDGTEMNTTATLVLTIPANKTLDLEGWLTSTDSAIDLTGAAATATVNINAVNGATGYINGGPGAPVNGNGGNILSKGEGKSTLLTNDNIDLYVNGGTVTAEGGFGVAIYASGNGAVTVIKGLVQATDTQQKHNAGVFNEGTGTVTVKGGTIIALGRYLDQDHDGGAGIYSASEGAINVEGGRIESEFAAIAAWGPAAVTISGDCVITGKTYGIGNESHGSVIITGGDISATGSQGSIALHNKKDGTVTVNGGKVYATNATGYAILNRGLEGKVGTVNVNGGEVTAPNYAIRNLAAGTVTVNGGTVSTTANSLSYAILNDSTGAIILNDGEILTKNSTDYAVYLSAVGGKLDLDGAADISGRIRIAGTAGKTGTITANVGNRRLIGFTPFTKTYYIELENTGTADTELFSDAKGRTGANTPSEAKAHFVVTNRASNVEVSYKPNSYLTSITNGVVFLSAPTTTLTISKVVTGNYADTTRSFTFSVNFKTSGGANLPSGTQFVYVGGVVNGANAVMPANGMLTLDSAGKAMITLKHGQSIRIEGIATDAKIQIVESAYTGYTPFFIDSATGLSSANADTGVKTMSATERTFAFTNTRVSVPMTGIDAGNPGLFLLLPLLATVLCIAANRLAKARKFYQKGI
jgi:hypothetical protein